MNKYFIYYFSVIFSAELAFAQPFPNPHPSEEPVNLKTLCKAVSDENVEEVDRLLNSGLNPLVSCSSQGITPLYLANMHRNKDLVAALLAHITTYESIDWDSLNERFWRHEDRHFRQLLSNERSRIESLQGLEPSPAIKMCAAKENRGFLGLILCNGHGFIHTNVPLFGAPSVKKYDNSTGQLFELESEGDEYIGFYPKQAETAAVPPGFQEAFFQGLNNMGQRQRASLSAEYATMSGKSYYFPSGRSSSLTSVQSIGLAPIRYYLFGLGQAESKMAMPSVLMDERRFYSESALSSCQRSYVDLNTQEWDNLSHFLYDAKQKIDAGEMNYQALEMNCVDFVRKALQSTSKKEDLTDTFAKSRPLEFANSYGISLTSAWAHFQDKGFLRFVHRLVLG